MVAVASLLAVAAIGLLRWSWSQERRSHRLNGVAWGLMLVGLIVAWLDSGAWGASVAALVGMAAACLLLSQAALAAPSAPARASNRRVGMLPQGREALHLGRRVTTFLLVAIASYLAAMGVGLGLRELMLAAGGTETDANALALFVVPLAWTGFAMVVLMTPDRRRQIAILAIGAALALPTLVTGPMA